MRIVLHHLDAVQRRRVTLELAAWREDLETRLWRAELALAQGEALYDIKQLEIEVRAFSAIVSRIDRQSSAEHDADAA